MTPQAGAAPERLDYPVLVPFIIMHVMVLGVFWTGFTTTSVIMAVTLYVVRVFGITGGFHRYFSHRTYQTSRAWQFVMAFLGQMSMQSGVLWWAAKHRDHHRDSDTAADVHSPRQHGFWGAHLGWIFVPSRAAADYSRLQDFTRYPELLWLDRNRFAPGGIAAVACLLIDGLPGLFVGFILSTVLVYHATFMINSLAHVFGRQRYLTGDDSRNNWLLAIIALGEGWHNNHHYYPGAARNGFYWWEVDVTYYFLRGLEQVGLIWDLRAPPASVLRGEKPPSSAIIEKVAQHIASGVSVEALVLAVQQRWTGQGRRLEELREELRAKALQVKAGAEARWAEFDAHGLPSLEELRLKARKMFANTPSLDVAVERARDIIHTAVSRRLLAEPAAAELPLGG
jgi:stearoyl-CoA desaturase (delta-9 desaturase)